VVLDVDAIAKEVGTVRVANMVLLGAATPFIDIPYEKFENGIRYIFERKGADIVEVNLKALRAGKAIAERKL
jgi:indolepyruvate ferredoxin oxidoreductase, beta subunit